MSEDEINKHLEDAKKKNLFVVPESHARETLSNDKFTCKLYADNTYDLEGVKNERKD